MPGDLHFENLVDTVRIYLALLQKDKIMKTSLQNHDMIDKCMLLS